MRITTQMLYSQFNYNLQNSMNSVYQTDEQLASGQKLNSPSDDPAAVSEITSNKAELSSIAGYQNAIASADTLLTTTNTTLDSLHSLLSSAKQIEVDAQSGSTSTNDATLLNNLIQSAISAGNTKVGDRYIFAGYKSDQPAINSTSGMFQGTSDRIAMQVNNGTSVDVNVTADEVIAFGLTSATSSNSAYITATGGNFTSPTDVFTTNGGTLNISLNGGATSAIAIPAGATLANVRDAVNAANIGVRSEVVDLNVGGNPSDYRLMLSATPAAGASGISVSVTSTDGAGAGLNSLSTGAGSTLASVVNPDTTVVGAMGLLKTALSQGDQSGIQRALTDLDNVSNTILQKQSDVGIRMEMLSSEKALLASRDTDVTNNVSDKLMLSTVDIARLSAQSQQQQTALTSLRTITNGVLSSTLFDFLK